MNPLFQKLNRDSFARRREDNLKLAMPVSRGLASQRFRDALAKFSPTRYALTLNIAGDPIVVHKNGDVAQRPRVDRDAEQSIQTKQLAAIDAYEQARARIGWHPDLVQTSGAVPCAGVLDGVALPAGLTAVIGGAGAGKTPLAHALAAIDGDYTMVAYGEPLSGYMTDATTATRALALAFAEGKPIVFDSIKDLLSTASGGAMKSGLSRGVLPILTQLSIVASDAGVSLLTPLNPSSRDVELMEVLVEAVASNATSMLVHNASSPNNWSFMFRRGEGLERSTGELITGRDENGSMELISMRVVAGSDAAEVKKAANVKNPVFGVSVSSLDDGAIMRAIMKSIIRN